MNSFADDALIAFDNLTDMAGNVFSPTVRFGVTGLSRAGKTVFITALIHNLLHGGRMPMFEALAGGRISNSMLQPQPSMGIPRFAYEEHLNSLLEDRNWPDSTRAISELRLTLNYESASMWKRTVGPGTLNIDIVDYPGEWLLDLPLLAMSYEEWSGQSIEKSAAKTRMKHAVNWLKLLKNEAPDAPFDELRAKRNADAFTQYLRACREDKTAMSSLPPGRFLMPGDLEGSPALTFAPLEIEEGTQATPGSMHEQMQRRFEAYKTIVIKPFYREHFARLDRQIVLVDALQAINASSEAVQDLQIALSDILQSFKPGTGSWLTSIVSRKIDKILFAATKADHLHHESHDRLERILMDLVEGAVQNAKFNGAQVQVSALSAVRATREGYLGEEQDPLPVVLGVPMQGETINGEQFDGKRETAIFPGDLPNNLKELLATKSQNNPDLNFVRFRPPEVEKTPGGIELSLPHIRLDRALEFLFGDYLA